MQLKSAKEGAAPFPSLLRCDAGLVLVIELDGRTIGLVIDPA